MATAEGNVSEKVIPKDYEAFKSQYELGKELGSGRFGTVHIAKSVATSKEFAAKLCVCRRPSQRKDVDLEIEIMNILKHTRLANLCDAFLNEKEAVIVIELVTGGELFERIVDETFDLTENLAVSYLRQICDGVGYIHHNKILHLDLKPENILCSSPDNLQEIKIIDFGFARKYTPNTQLKVMYGTPEFVAPEVVNFDPLGPGTDMWSIGVITYVLVSGLSPFMGEDDLETLSNVTGCEWDFDDPSFDELSSEAKDFIEKLLVIQEKQRPSCEQCLQHPWLSDKAQTETKALDRKKSLIAAIENMRKFVARRKWARSINAVRAVGRFQSGLKKEESPVGKRRHSAAAARTRELMGI